MHEIESLVDLLELQLVGDHRIDLDLARHVPIDDFRHVRSPARAAKGRAFPHPAGHQLEGPRRYFLTRAGDADDDRLAPAAMRRFQRLAHDLHAAGAVERIVGAANLIGAAFGHIDEMRDDVALDLLRIDEMRHAEAFAPALLLAVDVDADDHIGAGEPQALDHVEADAAEAEDDGRRARLHFRRVDDRADARGDAAADIANLVE